MLLETSRLESRGYGRPYNLFTSSLKPMARMYRDKSCAIVALYDVKDCELAKQYSTATLDAEGRIVYLIEKPVEPKTTPIGTCIYILPKSSLGRLSEYLLEAADRDNLGRFVGWLCEREPVYGHILDGYWWDIGTIDQYQSQSNPPRAITLHIRIMPNAPPRNQP